MKIVNIDDLNMQLMDCIERLKSLNDPNCDKNEKMEVGTAKAVVEIGKVMISGFKVKADILKALSRADNPKNFNDMANKSGIMQIEQKNQ